MALNVYAYPINDNKRVDIIISKLEL